MFKSGLTIVLLVNIPSAPRSSTRALEAITYRRPRDPEATESAAQIPVVNVVAAEVAGALESL